MKALNVLILLIILIGISYYTPTPSLDSQGGWYCKDGTGVYENISGATTTINSFDELEDKTRFEWIDCIEEYRENGKNSTDPHQLR